MTDAPKLLPCPFCGGEAVMYEKSGGIAHIQCRDCPAMTDSLRHPDAAEIVASAWNTRDDRPKWRPMSNAPKDGTWIIVYVGVVDDDFAVARWNGEYWDMAPEEGYPNDRFDREFANPTHWTHLPEPPK